MNASEAAIAEAKGDGTFKVVGRKLVYTRGKRDMGWWFPTRLAATMALTTYRNHAKQELAKAQEQGETTT